jgi:hypothetical protein
LSGPNNWSVWGGIEMVFNFSCLWMGIKSSFYVQCQNLEWCSLGSENHMGGWTSKPKTTLFKVFISHQEPGKLFFPKWTTMIHLRGEKQPYVCDPYFGEPHMQGAILF